MLPLVNNERVRSFRAFSHAANTVGLTLFIALIFTAGPAAAGVNVPDWVRQAAAEPLTTYPPETKAVVLLDQTDYTVSAPGDYIQHSLWIVRILRPDGRGEGDLGVDLRQGEKLNYLHA